MYTMKDVHDINAKLIAEVDRVCREHNLKYFLDSGTLLGAVRHKGSIPWDDDVDLVIPRKDYEKFIEVCKNGALSDGFELVMPKDYGERSFFDFITHIAYTNSSIKPIEGEMEFYNNKLNQMVLDIFILDEIPEAAFSRKIQILKLKILYGLSWGHRYKLDYSEYSALQKIGVWVLSHIGKLFKQTTLERKYVKAAQKSNGKGSSLLYASNYPFEELNKTYKAEWFESSVELEYEGYKFRAPVGYKEILSELYGDYMQLPPVDKRLPEHYDVESEFFKIN